jgi:hypothetical protein
MPGSCTNARGHHPLQYAAHAHLQGRRCFRLIRESSPRCHHGTTPCHGSESGVATRVTLHAFSPPSLRQKGPFLVRIPTPTVKKGVDNRSVALYIDPFSIGIAPRRESLLY